MDLDFIINRINQRDHLPGIKAHEEVSPMNRPLSYEEIDTSAYKTSSVMFFVYSKNGIPYTVAIERTTYNGVHSGQIGLPGGKRELEDSSFFDTALRESNEEIGVDPEKVIHLKDLSTVFIPVSKFVVNPYISILDEVNPIFVPDPREVSGIVEIPLEQVMSHENLKKTNIPTKNGLVLKDVPYFDIEDRVIWGATALIFNEVRHILLDL